MIGAARTASRFLWSLALGRLKLTDDTKSVQTGQAQFSGDRLLDGVKLLQHFGFTSRPPKDSDVMAVFLSGDPAGGVVVASNHQPSRLKNLAEGDAAMFDARGAYIWLTPDGIRVQAHGKPVRVEGATTVTVVASEKVRLETPLLECTGDVVDHAGSNTVTLKSLRDAFNTHVHPGVQSGPSVSGQATPKAL